MGTRGFIGFVNNQIEKITYNHYDSYPSGLGIDVLAWARNADWDKVREQVANLRLVDEQAKPTAEEAIEFAIYSDRGVSEGDDWYATLRHTQGDPEKILAAGAMIDSGGFQFDSLFCEYGYLINLDDNTFEVYEGFQKNPTKTGRWATPENNTKVEADRAERVAENPGLTGIGTYYPVGLRAVWPLHELPTDEEFLLTTEGDVN